MTRRRHPAAPSDFHFRVDSLSLAPGTIIARDNGDRWLVSSTINGALFGRQLFVEHSDCALSWIGPDGRTWWRGELAEIRGEWCVRVVGE